MKTVERIISPPPQHWVGDGFPVRSLFSYNSQGAQAISPFLLLDYAGPYDFDASHIKRGVGEHPHKGFETVTIVYQGELAHRDSSGSGGLIGKGDVQWMTAGAGIIHEEFHSEAFTQNGGTLEMIQLWVNLPARDKTAPANYQTLLNADIPTVPLAHGAGFLRVIAGEFECVKGPANTYTPINAWDISLKKETSTSLNIPESHNCLLVVRKGKVQANGAQTAFAKDVVSFTQAGETINLSSESGCELLLISGQPIDEPVAGMGPFVMNTHDEIVQAVTDYKQGRFGQLQS